MPKRHSNPESKAANKALLRERELLHLAAIVESSDDAIIGKNLEGNITSWNKGAERLYGYRAAEVIGSPISILSPPERPDEVPLIMEKLRRGERVDHFQTERIAKDGRRFPISLTISPLCDDSGAIIGASTIARDISLQKAAEEAVRRSEKLAVTGRLAATVAHEINNPLEAVTNLIYLAAAELLPDSPARAYLEAADAELARVVEIARQTLGFHRDTAAPTAVVLSQLLEDVLTLYERKLHSRRINVERRYDVPGEITGMPGEIRQVMANLISNAFDAMPGGGKLCLHVYPGRDGDRRRGVRVSIADEGTGIPGTVRARLFEPFFTTKQDVGTGLGLWIARGILQKHQGSIRVYSSIRPPRTGTVFSLFFPSAAADSRTTAA
jgi:PAS domain S-box-containing protein